MVKVIVLGAGSGGHEDDEPCVLATFTTESPIEDGGMVPLPVGRPVHVVQVREAVIDGVWTQWVTTVE